MAQQTAVNWLAKELEGYGDPQVCEITWKDLESLVEQAKQMEKEQMKSIELPSDEDIESGMNQRLFLSDKNAHFNLGAKAGFKLGATWMKEQILNK